MPTLEGPIVLLAPLPPWLMLAALLGVINGAASFMLIGRHVSRLAWYVALGVCAAGLGQVVGLAAHAPAPLKIGDLNVLSSSAAVWLVIGSARLARL
ncbi:MAG: hypothetical protein M3336_06455 [Chloroflexota bacterium]|nr:hypothetical protein [Chloroflexota bacterium]